MLSLQPRTSRSCHVDGTGNDVLPTDFLQEVLLHRNRRRSNPNFPDGFSGIQNWRFKNNVRSLLAADADA
jgi:hypothetical protein